MKDQPSILFRITLWILRIFRRPYLWAKQKWPRHFESKLSVDELDTSRMLSEFNWLHRLFFGRGFEKIRFNDADLQNLEAARKKGPVVLMMRNWGQVEYNYFNDLFLRKKFPLALHNNRVRMGHWMPKSLHRSIVRKKLDLFYETKHWPYNNENFHLAEALQKNNPVLFCLNLSTGIHWMEEMPASQVAIFQELLEAQAALGKPVQLVPLHFIYDKHPGRVKKSLTDILLGERENPGYLRKMLLFLRNYKKRAVAKISEPIDLISLIDKFSASSDVARATKVAHHIQNIFDLETRQVTGPKLKSRRSLLTKIVENSKIRQKIRKIADQEDMKFEAAEKKVLHYLKEIASDIHFTVIELWDFFLSWLFNTLYDGLEVDEAGIAKLKKVAKNSPLILLPSHQSHIDYMLLSYVFYQYDLSLPHVCAGINLSFWPLGSIFRRSGGYFIRRSLPGDAYYPLALKSYVQELMREGYFQEFFIEGTRSRSGKLLPPKTGLLTMMVESFLEDGIEDLHFVPISIGYERIVEENSYLNEIKGAKKSQEKFTDLFTLPKFLRRRYGKVYLQFAEPISLKSTLSKKKTLLQQDPQAFKDFIKDFAQKICLDINAVTPLMPIPLVATALLSYRQKSMTQNEIFQRSEALLSLAKSHAARLSESLQNNPEFSIEEVLEQFVKEGLIRFHLDMEGDFYTIPEESRAHLDFFKNKGIHVFVKASLSQLCARRGGSRTAPTTQDLLSREFFFTSEPNTFTHEKNPDWLAEIILPILESYWLTMQTIQRYPIVKIEEKVLIRKILELGETLKLRGTLVYSESLSRFSIQNAIYRFTEMEILKDHQQEMGRQGRHYFSLGEKKREEVTQLLRTLLER